jgi:putative transposase
MYMVTAGTYTKAHYLRSRPRLRHFCETLLSLAESYGWQMQAWAALSNHYHFVAMSPAEGKESLPLFLADLHRQTATYLNNLDKTPGRKVWHNYYDTPLTYQKSYYARLNYVNKNAVKHGLVPKAEDYPWCSATWFAKTVPVSFRKTIESFKTDKLNVYDEY